MNNRTTKSTEAKKRVTLEVPASLHQALKVKAFSAGLQMNHVVLPLIAAWVNSDCVGIPSFDLQKSNKEIDLLYKFQEMLAEWEATR